MLAGGWEVIWEVPGRGLANRCKRDREGVSATDWRALHTWELLQADPDEAEDVLPVCLTPRLACLPHVVEVRPSFLRVRKVRIKIFNIQRH